MRDKKQENEFHVTVNDQKLEEIKAQDGHTYVVMPLFSKVSYGVEFKEEIKGHGAIEYLSQTWPVCPYKVACRNLGNKVQKAKLYVDGQKVSKKTIQPFSSHVFEGIPTADGLRELLFSLPRFVTSQEQSRGSGRGLKRSRASDIGTVKVVWQEIVKTRTRFNNSHRTYKVTPFTQANKSDAKATGGGGAGGGDSGKAHASTTRAGKLIALNKPRACKVSYYATTGEPTEARLLYRTQHTLEDMGVLGKNDTDAESAERKAKRERRRTKAKLRQASSSLPTPVLVEDVKAEGPPPVPAGTDDDEVIVL